MAYGSHDEKQEPADSDYDAFLALLKLPAEEMVSVVEESPPPVVEEGTFGAVIHVVCEQFDGAKDAVPEGGAKYGLRRSEGAKNTAPEGSATKRSVDSSKRLSGQSGSNPSSRSGSGGPARSRSKSTKSGSTKGTGASGRRSTPRRGRKDQGMAREDGASSSSIQATAEGAGSENKPSNGAGQERGSRRRSPDKRPAEDVVAKLLESTARPRASFSATRQRSNSTPLPTIFEADAKRPRPPLRRRSDPEPSAVEARDFVPETALLAGLCHPHIVQLHRRAMGFVIDRPHQTLKDRMGEWREDGYLRRGPGVKQLEVAHAVADAVAYLHSRNIVHRNLKHDNVGFDRGGVPRLFNLDDAAVLPGTEGANPTGLLHGRRGTPRYMAPEVGLSRGYGPPADVYSFGILLWELCALATPFTNMGSVAAFEERVFVRGMRPEVDDRWPEDVKKLMKGCWSAAPGARPRMRDVEAALSLAVSRVPGEGGRRRRGRFRSKLTRSF